MLHCCFIKLFLNKSDKKNIPGCIIKTPFAKLLNLVDFASAISAFVMLIHKCLDCYHGYC